jgi:hypothetical protein
MILYLVIFIFWLCSIVLTIGICEYYPVFHPSGYFIASSEFLELSGLTNYVLLFSENSVVVFASRTDGIIMDAKCDCDWTKLAKSWKLNIADSPNEDLFPSSQVVVYDKFAKELSLWNEDNTMCLFRGFASFEMNKSL